MWKISNWFNKNKYEKKTEEKKKTKEEIKKENDRGALIISLCIWGVCVFVILAGMLLILL